ncbi:MAG: hypothetical protein CMB73_05240 [Euryarchaeota archaeon]|nr:hypothetical protein [Euryarchaeota archaeon]
MPSWVERWTYEGNGHIKNPIRSVIFNPLKIDQDFVDYRLSPSKSHLIRVLGLTLLTGKEVLISGVNGAGLDALAMRRCCIQMGMKIIDLDEDMNVLSNGTRFVPPQNTCYWKASSSGIEKPISVLNAENSGTALRLLIGIASSLKYPVMLDGDNSLRSRHSTELLAALSQGSVRISHGRGSENLPLIVEGPANFDEISTLESSKSSQFISSLIFASKDIKKQTEIKLVGNQVSRKHSQLTMELSNLFGAGVELTDNSLLLKPWKQANITEYQVPSDLSMLSFALLFSRVSQCKVRIENIPDVVNGLGNEILLIHLSSLGFSQDGEFFSSNENSETLDLDLTDSNDLITPLSAILALGKGGRIHGSAHAAHKESNRLEKTKELLEMFGLECSLTGDGIEVPGNQTIKTPKGIVRTYHDHRIAMTAMILATVKGATIETPNLCKVSDFLFRERLSEVWDSAMSPEVLIDVVE